ncbi:MAG: histidine kinase [Ruminococcus sp.]|nr:histidine kinase [Ruminococcus sp.]
MALLLGISIRYFNASSKGKNAVCILIICQAVLTSVLEYKNILPETSNTVTALAILEYYVYLNLIYQQNLRETIIQRELDVQKEKLLMLRNQIHPHFIYNSLSIIRALAKRDSVRAVNSIDIFSAYLRNHISAIESDELVPFEKELSNVGVYIDLVRADKTKKIIVEYDLKTKDFEIPPLSLEPIVENAVNYGISRDGGKITIGSDEDEQSYFVIIKDDGSGASSPKNEETVHTGIGLENTRKRLAMLCDGSLEIVLGDKGAAVTVTIPKKTDSKEDNTNESAYS